MSGNKVLTDIQHKVAFQNRVINAKGRKTKLAEARELLPVQLFDDSVEWMTRHGKFPSQLNRPFPYTVKEIGPNNPLEPTSFKKEIAWAISLLKTNGRKLNKFVRLRKEVELSLLVGNKDAANNALYEIKSELGFSYWWIEHTIATKQLFEGTASQKSFTTEIRSSLAPRSIKRFIVNQISLRNEPSVNPTRFVSQLQKKIESFPFNSGWKSIIRYHTVDRFTTSVNTALEVVRFSTTQSTVDLYEAIIHLAKVVSTHENLVIEERTLLKALKSLRVIVEDKRLESLAFLLSKGENGTLANKDLKPYNELIQANYEEKGSCIITDDPTNLPRYFNYCILDNECIGNDSLSITLANALKDVLNKKDGADAGMIRLHRSTLCFPGFEIFSALHAIASGETLNQFEVGSLGTNLIEDKANAHTIYALSPALYFNPILLRYSPSILNEKLIGFALRENIIQYPNYPWLNSSSTNTSIISILESSLDRIYLFYLPVL